VGKVSAELKELEPQLVDAEQALADLLAKVPNVPADSAPDGMTEEDAVEIKRVGEPPSFGFEPRDHVALGELLGVLDTERGARTSGSRFVYLLGDLVYVHFALVRHALDILVARGFLPVIPPVLVREEAMYGTGFLPTDEVNIYVTTEDQLYLVGTSEVPLAAFRMGEIVDEAELPVLYAGYSTCFRREAGSYGKDLGGMFRVHQFDKVEMFAFTTPETSWDMHERIVAIEEEIVGNLGLPYRVMNIAAGDLGGSAAKKYDIEVWLPGQDRYRELTSCSNCTDYQARRPGAPPPIVRRHRDAAHQRDGDRRRTHADHRRATSSRTAGRAKALQAYLPDRLASRALGVEGLPAFWRPQAWGPLGSSIGGRSTRPRAPGARPRSLVGP
jgi:seryl-tRNA synthetase